MMVELEMDFSVDESQTLKVCNGNDVEWASTDITHDKMGLTADGAAVTSVQLT